MEIKYAIGKQSPLINDALSIRQQVFIKEQGFNPLLEIDKYDDVALHIVAYTNNEPVGVARLIFKENGKAKIGRVAVLKAYRQSGVGKQLIEFLINYAQQHHLSELNLSSQLQAKHFYTKLGFQPQSEVYLEEEVEHISMVLPIS
ncbi:MAG: GNAT family N-acetyltransferase [Candidatus Schmidhempelia sp.]|nr:GNAT family N-acetyltransferase [Candidatus Schmidhempelia sp.]